MEYSMKKDSHRSDLRQVVSSLKDLKSCLCKLISVQKKQIELELTRRTIEGLNPRQDPIVGKPNADNVSVTSIDAPPSPPFGMVEPQGAFITKSKLKEESTTTEKENSTAVTPSGILKGTQINSTSTTEPSRDKRGALRSDFVEIHPGDLEHLSEAGFTFNSDEEREKAFLAEHVETEADVHVTLPVNPPHEPVAIERKPRQVDLENDDSATEDTTSLEAPTPAENLRVTYDRMERTKSAAVRNRKNYSHLFI